MLPRFDVGRLEGLRSLTEKLECQEVGYDFSLNSTSFLFLPDLHQIAATPY
ncbi:hypothetical protein [Nostoc sp.]|uniref:hypothetical protein n=1 Tax=Nostoc sp. TaxID=1180 RepID=UPI002FF9B434